MSPCPSEPDRVPHLIVLGNPENRRVRLFADAVARDWSGGVEAVSWLDFLNDPRALVSRLRPGAILRIESPGENFEVERALLRLGSDEMAGGQFTRMSPAEIARLEFQKGRVLPIRQWYCGWRRALLGVARCLEAIPGLRVMNPPDEIAAMFDKARCHELFRGQGVAVPPLLGIPGSYAELRAMMSASKCRRIFLKPCHSSSASGVVALEVTAGRAQAFSSVELVREHGTVSLFNSLRVRRYVGEREILELMEAVCRERSVAEAWLPKAGFEGRRFDLRVVVIAGSAAHVVVRQSDGPMTNLHLGNRRGDVLRLRERIGEANWRAAMSTCEQAAAAFPRSFYAAIDLLVSPSFRRFAVAEVNAFGDLLPDVLHDGRDTYSAELAALSGATLPRAFAKDVQVSTTGR